MNDQLYELTVEKNHLNIIIKALSNYICSQYDGLDAEIVDIPKTMENIKIAADMQLVLKHHLGGVQHSPKQTAETTGLVWIGCRWRICSHSIMMKTCNTQMKFYNKLGTMLKNVIKIFYNGCQINKLFDKIFKLF